MGRSRGGEEGRNEEESGGKCEEQSNKDCACHD